MLGDDRLERGGQLAHVLGGQVGVVLDAACLLHRRDRVLEQVTLDVEYHLREHLHEAAVAVPRESLVACLADDPLNRDVVEPEVEDGVHHSRHRERRAGAHRDEQRVVRVAELLAHLGFELAHVLDDLLGQAGREAGWIGVVILHARLTADREARRNRQPHVGHLREVGPLATKDELHVLVALGVAAAECVDTLDVRQLSLPHVRGTKANRIIPYRSRAPSACRSTAQSFVTTAALTWRSISCAASSTARLSVCTTRHPIRLIRARASSSSASIASRSA